MQTYYGLLNWKRCLNCCSFIYLSQLSLQVEASWNVMEHAQKPDFVFRRNGRVRLNLRGCQFSRILAAEVCASAFIVGSNAGYTMFRGSVMGTGYPLHSPVSPSLTLPCVTVCHHISTGVYFRCEDCDTWSKLGACHIRCNRSNIIHEV